MKKLLVLAGVLAMLAMTACSSAPAADQFSATEKGYGGDVTVTLDVADGKITNVAITGDGETKGVGTNAIEQMPQMIVDAQTYDVDAVSGATITSTSIKKAAKAAMVEAGLVSAEAGGCETLTLDSINEFLNTSADMGEGTVANAVALIPINHVNGPRDEHDFYAFVNYKYTARKYIKYQITYLSCTCRSADVNYWMTAYVELTLPESGKLEDSEVKVLSFDYDGPNGHYLAGYWGDSNPTPAGHTYEQIKEEYISYFIDKNYGYISTLNFVDDIAAEDYSAGEGREGYSLDTFTGSSVSTNNIIRMLNALFEYHGTDKFFNK
ncbi:MAG: FMN-binding protein [Erysipelotrichaceae bacterium]|nr:FMN-binding protein [Erysipelotrichaceae bacterium]